LLAPERLDSAVEETRNILVRVAVLVNLWARGWRHGFPSAASEHPGQECYAV